MFGRRMQLAVLLFLGLLLVCIGKLAHLQLVQQDMYTLKALQSEWNRLAAVLAELYPRKTHGPKRIGKSLKAA